MGEGWSQEYRGGRDQDGVGIEMRGERRDAGASLRSALGARCSDSPPHSQTTQQLVLQTLRLSNRRQSSVLDLFGVQLQRSLGKLESLLDQRLEFTDPSALVSKDFLGVRSSDNDLGTGVGDSDFTARVELLGEFTGATRATHASTHER